MTRLDEWLAPRLEAAPPSLRERIVEAVTRSGEQGAVPSRRESELHLSPEGTAPCSPLPDTLRAIANLLVDEAKAGPPNRDTALTLLAADALITFAMEAEFE